MVSKNKQDSFETLEFFFEDAIMLRRFMDYFDGFNLEVDNSLYKNNLAQRMIRDGVPDMDIAEEIDIPYKVVWNIKDRLIKRGLLRHSIKDK